jgi:nitric oxide dioxygenase
MLGHLSATGSARPVTVVHADRSPDHHAHRDEQAALVASLTDARLHLWYEEPGERAPEASAAGRVDVDALDLPAGLTACLCGPLPFMRTVRGDLLRRGVPAERIHYEVFGPDLWLGR